MKNHNTTMSNLKITIENLLTAKQHHIDIDGKYLKINEHFFNTKIFPVMNDVAALLSSVKINSITDEAKTALQQFNITFKLT